MRKTLTRTTVVAVTIFRARLRSLQRRLRTKGNRSARGRGQDRQSRRLRSRDRKRPANHEEPGNTGNDTSLASRFAGPEAGAIVSSIEYPSFDALADAYKKTNASPEYQAWVKDLEKIRKIVSDSLYTEW